MRTHFRAFEDFQKALKSAYSRVVNHNITYVHYGKTVTYYMIVHALIVLLSRVSQINHPILQLLSNCLFKGK